MAAQSSPAKPATPSRAERPSLTLTRRFRARPKKSTPRGPTRKSWRTGSRPAQVEARLGQGRHRSCASAAAIASASTPKGDYYEVGGVYREVVPNQRLVFSWAWHSTPERESLVTMSIKPDGAGTLLTFTHEQFSDEAARDNHERGWTRAVRQARKLSGLNTGSRPCSRTRSSPARNGSPRARPIMAHEKEFTSARERLAEERRALPWVKVDKDYVFDGPDGKADAGRSVQGRSQLVVQHFMFAPDWDAGCKSCSFWADGFERMVPHLAARDTTHGRDLARAAAKARCVQAADGLDVRLVFVGRQRFQL